jgi:hypothetical protein
VTRTVIADLLKNEANRRAIVEAAAKKLADAGGTGAPVPKFSYAIARVAVPSAQQIRVNRERQQALAQRAVEAEQRRLRAQPQTLGVEGVTGAGANINLRGYQLDESGSAVPAAPGGITPPLNLPPGIGNLGQPAEDPNALARLLVDPVTNEDIRGDWEVTVLIAVVLDPQAAPAAGGEAPPPTPTTPPAETPVEL